MSDDQTNERIKQSPLKVFQNNFYFIRMIFQASPAFVIFPAIDAIRNQSSIYIEHVVLVNFILMAIKNGFSFPDVAFVILLIAGLVTLGMVFNVVTTDVVMEKRRPKVQERIKMRIYEKARSVDLACYDDPEFYNQQVLAISEIDMQIDANIGFFTTVIDSLTCVILTGLFYFLNDALSLVFVIFSLVTSFFLEQLYNKLDFKIHLRRNPLQRKRDYVKRSFYLPDHAKEIRLDPEVADILVHDFEDANEKVYQAEKSLAKKKCLVSFITGYILNDFITYVVYIVYLLYRSLVLHALPAEVAFVFLYRIGDMKSSMQVFTEGYVIASKNSLYIQKVRDFMDYKSKVVSTSTDVPASEAKELVLRNVGFSYKADLPAVLSDISLKVHPGEKIALVGYNGAGKTTLVKLLMRLYDVSSGEILADGKNVKDYDLTAYRNSIGTVFQDFEIFAGSVKENVVLDVANHADEARVRQALDDSGLLKRVDALPMKLDTPLTHEFSEQGVDMSGGERQKLAISRVFYQNASLMILDEPSSALDPIAEYQLNHAMLSATKDKTVIFISHRLSTTRLADRIFMLEKGRIVEEGTHDSLLAKDGKYAEMWKAQAGAYIEV